MLISFNEFKERIGLIASKQYNAHLPTLQKFLSFTGMPLFRNSGGYSLALQFGMLGAIEKFEDAIRRSSALLKEEKNLQRKESLKKAILINRACIKIIKTTADGMAWRAFRCHRPRLMIMSDNSGAGRAVPSYPGWDKLKMRKGFFIVNDLTRCLRIADVSHVFDDGKIILEEFKDNGKTIRTMGTVIDDLIKFRRLPNKQELRLIIAQSAIIEDRLSVPTANWIKVPKADFLNLDFEIPSHLKRVEELIKQANKNGFAHAMLEDGYFIEIHAYDKLVSMGGKRFDGIFSKMKVDYEAKKPEWLEKENADIESLTNYDALIDAGDEFPRNMTPASVLPFSAKNRMRIMSGHLFVRVSISNEILKNKLKAAGWNMKEITQDPQIKTRKDFSRHRNLSKGNFYTYGDRPGFVPFVLYKQEGKRRFNVPFIYELIPITLSSFHGLDFIVNTVNGIYKKRHDSDIGAVMLNFTYENELFCKPDPSSIPYYFGLLSAMLWTYVRSFLRPRAI